MALQMYALIRVSDNSKVTESRETTHLNNGNEAWVPIVYEDQPEVTDNQVAERTEALDGAVWRKSWSVRNKTQAEKDADKDKQKENDKRAMRSTIEDAVYLLATGGDLSAFIAQYEEIRDR